MECRGCTGISKKEWTGQPFIWRLHCEKENNTTCAFLSFAKVKPTENFRFARENFDYFLLFPWQERLAHLKRQCQPHLTEAVKSSVEGICTKIYNQSCESVKKVHEKHWAILKDQGISRECKRTEAYFQAARDCKPRRKSYACVIVTVVVVGGTRRPLTLNPSGLDALPQSQIPSFGSHPISGPSLSGTWAHRELSAESVISTVWTERPSLIGMFVSFSGGKHQVATWEESDVLSCTTGLSVAASTSHHGHQQCGRRHHNHQIHERLA